jgi:hypothetical protein
MREELSNDNEIEMIKVKFENEDNFLICIILFKPELNEFRIVKLSSSVNNDLPFMFEVVHFIDAVQFDVEYSKDKLETSISRLAYSYQWNISVDILEDYN